MQLRQSAKECEKEEADVDEVEEYIEENRE